LAGKDEGMFRRLTRLVTTPARDLVSGATRDTDARPTEYDKAEMKAMIERKRRNDYVRKRELDTLRRIRREGLSADQAAALTMQSSRMDDSEVRSTQQSVQTDGIKAKIDAIERQMVGVSSGVSAGPGSNTGAGGRPSRTPPTLPPGPPPPILTTTIFDEDDGAPPTVPVALVSDDEPAATHAPTVPVSQLPEDTRPLSFELLPDPEPAPAPRPLHAPPLLTDRPDAAMMSPTPPAKTPAPAPSYARPPMPISAVPFASSDFVEVQEIVHDASLDEPVIAFAGGDFQSCEGALLTMVGARGERRDHEETWLVLFDLYRAIGQQSKFESLTMDYVERFHRSAPQWFSLPRLLAEATGTPAAEERLGGGIGWVCPPQLDADSVMRLDALSMQLPLPWVMDWTNLTGVDVDAAARLRDLMTRWAGQSIAMRWVAGDRLFSVLQDLAPTGLRDADPVYWMLRLEALRLAHRPDQFDEVAIDYCVTYEVSPPSWENARCNAHVIGANMNTRTLSLSVVGDAVTSFQDTSIGEETSSPIRVSTMELAGQLSGDLGEQLARLTAQAGDAKVVRINCSLLMRVDFVAAGDLLNWVAQRHGQGGEIVFMETHRLVALMFGAMGITEHARVQLRTN
jgi:ABC-type transporter Mla MlaB component